ncbi:MAG: hypothetical protein IT290_02405 [Deltaproteobacteria bacterium]|nr:hypothetical protein [Deltaproteobacteria bacterium]
MENSHRDRIVDAFREATEHLGATFARIQENYYTATLAPFPPVELHVQPNGIAFGLSMRAGNDSANYDALISDKAGEARAKAWVKHFAPQILSSEGPDPRDSHGSSVGLELHGMGIAIRPEEATFDAGFVDALNGGRLLVTSMYTKAGMRSAAFMANERGAFELIGGEGMPSVADVVSHAPSSLMTPFHIIDLARRFAVAFPMETRLIATPNGGSRAYELRLGQLRDEGAVMVRGPFVAPDIPPLSQLTSPNQKRVGESKEGEDVIWVENQYEFGGLEFRQIHVFGVLDGKSGVLVTGQSRSRFFDETRKVALDVASSARWTAEEHCILES